MSNHNKEELQKALIRLTPFYKFGKMNRYGIRAIVLWFILYFSHLVYGVLTYGWEFFQFENFTSDLDRIFHFITEFLFIFWLVTEFLFYIQIKIVVKDIIDATVIEAHTELEFEED